MFIEKWRAAALKDRSGSEGQCIDLRRLLGEPTGESCCFERGARRDTSGEGRFDVWKPHGFAWVRKGRHAKLDAALDQPRQFALDWEDPPLLIVWDRVRFRILANWTNSASETHGFADRHKRQRC